MQPDLTPIAGLPVLPALNSAGVRSFFTTRLGGVGTGPYASLNLGAHTADDPAIVAANRRRLQAALPSPPVWLAQVHGVTVWDADTLSAPSPQADASVTTTPGRVLTILVADCLPVVIAETHGRALGVAHAGWRGLAAGVLEHTVAALKLRYHARGPDADWQAWIGPAIGASAFAVGPDVRAAFTTPGDAAGFIVHPGQSPTQPPTQPSKWLADLPALAEARLRRAGVAQIQHAQLCTASHPDLFFSHRRDGGVTGRMALCAWLTG